MASTKDIVSFLKQLPLEVEIYGAPSECVEVQGVKNSDSASEGDLSWVSEQRYNSDPNCFWNFRGSCLIVPAVAKISVKVPFVAIATSNPKLAFIRVFNQYFGHLYRLDLPGENDTAISPEARIGKGAEISKGVVVGPSVDIGENVWIGANSVIANAKIGNNVRIGCNCSIGLSGFGYERDDSGQYWRFPHLGNVVIESDVEIGSNTCIDRGSLGNTEIKKGAKIDNLVHIAHNVAIGENCLVIANSMLGGSARIGDGVWIAPSVSIMNQATISDGSVLGMGAVVLKSVLEPGSTMVGNPAKQLPKKGKK